VVAASTSPAFNVARRIRAGSMSAQGVRSAPLPDLGPGWGTAMDEHRPARLCLLNIRPGWFFSAFPTCDRTRLEIITASQNPWQNGTAERFVGSVRRELLDHVVVLNEAHLRRLIREYVGYYNAERAHTAISDAPTGRESEPRPSSGARVVALPRVVSVNAPRPPHAATRSR
jgi:hypothetical protein